MKFNFNTWYNGFFARNLGNCVIGEEGFGPIIGRALGVKHRTLCPLSFVHPAGL